MSRPEGFAPSVRRVTSHAPVRAVLGQVTREMASKAEAGRSCIRRLDCCDNLAVLIDMQECGLGVIEGDVLLDNELAMHQVIGLQSAQASGKDQLVHLLLVRHSRRRNTIDTVPSIG